MAVLKDRFHAETGVELEIKVSPASCPPPLFNESTRQIRLEVNFRYGHSYPEIALRYECLRGYVDYFIGNIPYLISKKCEFLSTAAEKDSFALCVLSIDAEEDYLLCPDKYPVTFRHKILTKEDEWENNTDLTFNLSVSKNTLLEAVESWKAELQEAIEIQNQIKPTS